MAKAERSTENLPPYAGFHSRVVKIGELEMGGNFPIRIQSMTNTPTLDTGSTVSQIIALADAGCELVRITAQNLREAHHLKVIKKELISKGFHVPLAADIHFLPEAAEIAAQIVEKVRINPGNYSDKKKNLVTHISERDYKEELERIATRIQPLLRICSENGTVLRIGTNHGSLSDRIVQRYGNTPEGMVESALEFVRICRDSGFHNLVLSMKASNILTVLHSNRLLVARMKAEAMDYPIHLGVTEAGEGTDGRIKSAAGIGVLLSEGIGDTIRVSLTEDPVMEIPFASKLASLFNDRNARKPLREMLQAVHPFHYERIERKETGMIGGSNPPVVVGKDAIQDSSVSQPDLLVRDEYLEGREDGVKIQKKDVIFFKVKSTDSLDILRKNMTGTVEENDQNPVIIRIDAGQLTGEDLLINTSINLAALLTDGFGDGIMISGGKETPEEQQIKLAYDILQATGRRISKTEYISCPSCGRTQFDIQEALREVKEKTGHLAGLKIAVMGCIVNGPGEMADADYGYVGAGPGKVNIFKHRTLIRRNVPQEEAVKELLRIIDHPRNH